jgi:hypothetical protein
MTTLKMLAKKDLLRHPGATLNMDFIADSQADLYIIDSLDTLLRQKMGDKKRKAVDPDNVIGGPRTSPKRNKTEPAQISLRY